MQVILTEQTLSRLEEKRIYTSIDGSRRLRIGDPIFFHPETIVSPYSAILSGFVFPSIGSFSYTQRQLPESMLVGRYCSIAHGLGVIGGNHPTDYVSTSSFSYDANLVIFKKCLEDDEVSQFTRYGLNLSRPDRHELPIIGNDVWIGGGVTLARGISLGDGCVVAASSVVTKSVPPYAIVGGNPAKIIRMRFEERIVEQLLKSSWWQYKFTNFGNMNYNSVEQFLERFNVAVESNTIQPFPEEKTRLVDLVAE